MEKATRFTLSVKITFVILLILFFLPIYTGLTDNGFYLDLVNRLMILAIAAASLNLILGHGGCLLYTSPSPRDGLLSRMPSSA